jgi:hypothetical protein
MEQFKNALTIHLYCKDEVLASLRWAIIVHNFTETAFWGLELYDSNMEHDVIYMLSRLWISQVGFGSFGLLESLGSVDISDRDAWVSYLMAWTRVRIHDSTAFHLLLRGASESATWTPHFTHNKEYMGMKDALEDCLRRGKLVDAWLIGRAVDSAEQWCLLERLAIEVGRSRELTVLRESDLSDCEQRAAAYTMVCLGGETWSAALKDINTSDPPIEVKQAIDDWDAEDSLRKRRVFKVQAKAIGFITERSSQSKDISSESQITDDLVESLKQSMYWSSILQNYMNDGDWLSDSAKEEFFDTFFPLRLHDIPDEWSEAEREKSHGRGLGRDPQVGQEWFLDSIFQKSVTLGIWKREPFVSGVCSGSSGTSLDEIYDGIQLACRDTIATQFPMKPVQKVFTIT